MQDLDFNKQTSTVMHIDLNSCFASVEQQANPLYRNKPLAVAAYDSPGGCILAASIEAKQLGIKTGMRVREAKQIYPNLIVKLPDPPKYRFVHKKLEDLISHYTNDYLPKSIDEFVLDLTDYLEIYDSGSEPGMTKRGSGMTKRGIIYDVAKEIKKRIRVEVGDWLRVSIGIGPSSFIAKLASGLHKPDGLDEINYTNFREVYSQVGLRDLCGINYRNEARLNSVGIYTVNDFYEANITKLKSAFASIASLYWFMRLRGYEIDYMQFGRKSYGNSYAFPHHDGKIESLLPVLSKLVVKATARMRADGYLSGGVNVGLLFRGGQGYWHKSEKLKQGHFDTQELFKHSVRLLRYCKNMKPVHTLSVSFFELREIENLQLGLFEETERKCSLNFAVDAVNNRWGDFSIVPSRALLAADAVADRISFGSVKQINQI